MLPRTTTCTTSFRRRKAVVPAAVLVLLLLAADAGAEERAEGPAGGASGTQGTTAPHPNVRTVALNTEAMAQNGGRIETPPAPARNDVGHFDDTEIALPSTVAPPPSSVNYLQYGVAFTGEFVANAGPICGDDTLACILGSGGGIAVRIGIRRSGPWYFGGAYELSKQDPSKLYRLAILQQLRFEVRHHFYTARTTQPFIAAHAGLAGYGNEWSVATWGASAFLGAGFESQIPNGPLVGMTVGYRAMYLRSFDDSSGLHHAAGVAHFVCIDATLEARDRL